MKKALVLLLILAVAGGVFAQDVTVGIKGEIRLDTQIDFMPKDNPTMDSQASDISGDNYGLAGITVDKGSAHAEFTFKGDFAAQAGYLQGMAEYGDGVNGDSTTPFKVHAGINIIDTAAFGFNGDPDSLYAYWLFLDRQLKVDFAYKGYETIYWRVSDLVASDWDNLDGSSGVEISYMPAAVAGLNIGLFFPGGVANGDKGVINNLAEAYATAHGRIGVAGAFPSAAGGLFYDDFFKWTLFGAKYEMDTLAFSAMFHMAPSKWEEFNFGVKFTGIDSVTLRADAQFSALGQFGDAGWFSVGVNGEYAAAPITAGLSVKALNFEANSDNNDPNSSILEFGPYFYYDLILDTLQFRLCPTIGLGIADESKDTQYFNLETDLYWNMNKDGCTDDPAHGLLVQYLLNYDLKGSDATKSVLNLAFRWAF